MRKLEMPVMVGPSRKQFLKQESPQATEFATAAAVTAAILGGAHIVRVHDVAAMRPVAALADAIVRNAREAD
jgi:dihydropteroate synthase